VGRALEVLDDLASEGPFDAVFVDADKGSYDRYAEWARSNLRAGGLLLADNAYFFGRLMEDDPDAAAMRRMHEIVGADFDSVCIPTPDGLVLGIRRDGSRSDPTDPSSTGS
jgi:caffeoyl-CoA O-methyltransferase